VAGWPVVWVVGAGGLVNVIHVGGGGGKTVHSTLPIVHSNTVSALHIPQCISQRMDSFEPLAKQLELGMEMIGSQFGFNIAFDPTNPPTHLSYLTLSRLDTHVHGRREDRESRAAGHWGGHEPLVYSGHVRIV